MNEQHCMYPTRFDVFCERCGMDEGAADHQSAPPGDAEPQDHAYSPPAAAVCGRPEGSARHKTVPHMNGLRPAHPDGFHAFAPGIFCPECGGTGEIVLFSLLARNPIGRAQTCQRCRGLRLVPFTPAPVSEAAR